MSESSSPTLIVAIPGTQETQELSRTAVIRGIESGQIGANYWVWSPFHNDWKLVGEIPELQPPRKAGPIHPRIPARVVKVAAAAVAVQSIPQIRQAAAKVRTGAAQPMKTENEFPLFKVMAAVAFLALAGILAANYFLVNQPFENNLATTSYRAVQVYAHLGAFTQPGALVIHIIPSRELNQDNFADFLVALAKSTPPQPITNAAFDGVGLTSLWQSQYIMNGSDWQKLGRMGSASSDEKEKFILEHLEQMSGAPLLIVRRRDSPASASAREAGAWQALVARFQLKSP